MKPGIDHVMMLMAGTLANKVLPALPDEHYTSGDVKMIALMQVLLAQEVDRAADNLLRENAGMRALFAEAAKAPLPALSDRLSDAAKTVDANARLSTLELGNAALKEILIELHVIVEEAGADWARSLNRQILVFLKNSADARMLAMPSI
jgi:hypothetical protein